MRVVRWVVTSEGGEDGRTHGLMCGLVQHLRYTNELRSGTGRGLSGRLSGGIGGLCGGLS